MFVRGFAVRAVSLGRLTFTFCLFIRAVGFMVFLCDWYFIRNSFGYMWFYYGLLVISYCFHLDYEGMSVRGICLGNVLALLCT